MAAVAIWTCIKNNISRKVIEVDFILVSNHVFLIPMNHLELLIYSFIVLDCFKIIQYYCQICEILTFFIYICS